MKSRILILALLAAGAATAAAHEGHEHATGVVRERMIAMETMGERLLAMSKRLRANKEMQQVVADAAAIEALAAKITALFPQGSTQAPTAAKPAVWQQWADFEAKANKLKAEAEKLAHMPTTDAAALRTQFRAVAFSCDGCHQTYRFTRN